MIFPNLIIKVERWKFNKDYGVYVSTLGNFKDRHKRRLSVWVDGKTGYCRIKTERGLKYAHRLVMFTWRPIPDAENLTVDHLNHNKRDNSLQNLEWVTKRENQRRARTDVVFVQEQNCKKSKKAKKKELNEKHPLIREVLEEGRKIAFFVSGNDFDTIEEAAEWAVESIIIRNIPIDKETTKVQIETILKNRLEGRIGFVTNKYGYSFGVKLV